MFRHFSLIDMTRSSDRVIVINCELTTNPRIRFFYIDCIYLIIVTFLRHFSYTHLVFYLLIKSHLYMQHLLDRASVKLKKKCKNLECGCQSHSQIRIMVFYPVPVKSQEFPFGNAHIARIICVLQVN